MLSTIISKIKLSGEGTHDIVPAGKLTDGSSHDVIVGGGGGGSIVTSVNSFAFPSQSTKGQYMLTVNSATQTVAWGYKSNMVLYDDSSAGRCFVLIANANNSKLSQLVYYS